MELPSKGQQRDLGNPSEPGPVACQELPRNPGASEAPGLVHAFVPAHRDSKADVVVRDLSRTLSEDLGFSVLLADFFARGFPLWGTAQAPQRLNEQTWGAFVTPGVSFDTLAAREAHPREIRHLLEEARRRYGVVCADLTEAKEIAAFEVLRASNAVFVVAGTDTASVDLVRYKLAWLRSIGVIENTGLLLRRAPDGLNANDVEDITGVPVCAMLDRMDQLRELARWVSVYARRPEPVGQAAAS